MVTYETLEEYRNKCATFLEELAAERDKGYEEIMAIEAQRKELLDQQLVVSGQIEALDQLMDIEKNPPIVELPMHGDNVEEEFEKRLDGPEGMSEEEVKESRKPVYLHEAVRAVEDISDANTEGQ